jgi:hypothetical protein
MRPSKKVSFESKSKSIKSGALKPTEEDSENAPRRVMIDYIDDEVPKPPPQSRSLKRNNTSLNRLISTKIVEKGGLRGRKSQLKDYQMLLQSRKRIATECGEERQGESQGEGRPGDP